MIPRPVVERRTLIRKHSPHDFQIFAKSIGHQIRAIEVANVEIHGVNIGSPRSIDNAANFRPDASRGTHSAGLQRAIKCTALKRRFTQLLPQLAQPHNFRMRRRVATKFRLVVRLHKHLPFAHNYTTHITRSTPRIPLPRLLDCKAQKGSIAQYR